MTISTTSDKITYEANGSTTVWSFSFPAGPNPDIQVFVTSATGVTQITTNLQINVNPPINPNPTSIGGSVVYPVSGPPLDPGNQITIVRVVPTVQPTSVSNQSIIYPPVIEQTFDYLTMEIQQVASQLGRSLQLPITEDGPLVIPPCPERASKFLGFDENCNLIVAGIINPITSTNALRVPPDEIIVPLPARPARPGTFISFDGGGEPILVSSLPPNVPPLLGSRQILSAAHTVLNSEDGFLFELTGNVFYDLTFGDPTTYDSDFSVAVFNADIYTGPGTGRAKRIMLNGVLMPGGYLWPGQWVYVFRFGSTWVTNPRDQRWRPGVPVTFFVDPALAPPDGQSDGLATGTGAIRTVASAVAVAQSRVDYGGLVVSNGATIQLAPGSYNENSIVINHPTVGGTPITIKGADDGVSPVPWNFQIAGGAYGFSLDCSTVVIVKGINFTSPGSNSVGFFINHGAALGINNCLFGTFAGTSSVHFFGMNGSTIDARDISITDGVGFHMILLRQTAVRYSGALTVGVGLTFNIFALAQFNCSIYGGTAAQGDPTDFHLVGGTGCVGIKYLVTNGSMGHLGAGVMDTLPGNVAGVTGATPLHGVDGSAVY